MATNPKRSNLAANTDADGVCALLDNGYCRIYSGAQPATADTALSGQTLLAELRWNADAAPAAVNGVSTFNVVTEDASADASGAPTWFRALKADGTSVVFDGTVGTADADLIVEASPFVAGSHIPMAVFTYTANKG